MSWKRTLFLILPLVMLVMIIASSCSSSKTMAASAVVDLSKANKGKHITLSYDFGERHISDDPQDIQQFIKILQNTQVKRVKQAPIAGGTSIVVSDEQNQYLFGVGFLGGVIGIGNGYYTYSMNPEIEQSLKQLIQHLKDKH